MLTEFHIKRPTIGTLHSIEQRSGMKIATLIAIFNSGNPPAPLQTLLSEIIWGNEEKQQALSLQNFLLEGIGYYEYGDQSLSAEELKNLNTTNWLDMFKTYVGTMGHSAQEFWQLTLQEYLLAVEGFSVLHHIENATISTPATSNELASMMEIFPD